MDKLERCQRHFGMVTGEHCLAKRAECSRGRIGARAYHAFCIDLAYPWQYHECFDEMINFTTKPETKMNGA